MAKIPYDGYKLYIVHHKKMNRRMACLVRPEGRKTIAYARYLMSVHLGRFLTDAETVDHINNDKMDDRIENFQLLTAAENKAKSQKPATYFDFLCPVCGKQFQLIARQAYKKENPACSRACGYEKMKNKSKNKMVD